MRSPLDKRPLNHHAVVIAHLLFTFLAFKVLQPFEYPLNVILQDIFITFARE